MLTSLRNRLLFHARAKVYDVSGEVEWTNATMYDQDDVVDKYDVSALKNGAQINTFRAPYNLEFIDMVGTLGIRSVLDIGCGAGSFYHALSSAYPGIDYLGFDLASAQIARATSRFGERFAVRDAASISEQEFARFDAVHAHSVFSFMPVSDQLETIGRILRSGAMLLLETGATLPDIRYVPRSSFKNFLKLEIDGQALLTAVSFPFRSELEAVAMGNDHQLSHTERPYGGSRLLNGSSRAGGALVKKSELARRHRRFERICQYADESRLIWARIAPKAWDLQKRLDYAALSKDEVHGRITALLKPI